MITSALIAECRREYGDEPKTTRVSQQGNASVNIFNVGKFPILESSYVIYVSGNAKAENTDYTFNLDNGDLTLNVTPPNGVSVVSQHKYAEWRDKNWVEALNQGIEALNARGFFRQIIRSTSAIKLSAGQQVYNGPSGCVDMYEFLVKSGSDYVKPVTNWAYQQDANKLVVGSRPTSPNSAAISYLRNLRTYAATSATVDILGDWKELIKKKAGAIFYRSLAGKIAKQGNATVDEGHFSFTNCRAMASDLNDEFDKLAMRKKPTRPAKDIQYNAGGVI